MHFKFCTTVAAAAALTLGAAGAWAQDKVEIEVEVERDREPAEIDQERWEEIKDEHDLVHVNRTYVEPVDEPVRGVRDARSDQDFGHTSGINFEGHRQVVRERNYGWTHDFNRRRAPYREVRVDVPGPVPGTETQEARAEAEEWRPGRNQSPGPASASTSTDDPRRPPRSAGYSDQPRGEGNDWRYESDRRYDGDRRYDR